MKRIIAILSLACSAGSHASDDGELAVAPSVLPRYALVLTISDYASHPNVANAWNDGLAMAKALYDLDFNLVRHVVEPRTKDDLHFEVQRFKAESHASQRPAIVVVYVASHGFQLGGESFVAGADAPDEAPETESLSVQEIAESLVPQKGGITILLIDACRTPADFGGHPVRMSVNTELEGVLIVYATKSGQTAQSVSATRQSQSPFSYALDTYLKMGNESIENVMRYVGNQMSKDVGQQPAVSKLAALGSPEVYLRPAGNTVERHGNALLRAYQTMPTRDCMQDFNQMFPANAFTNWAATAASIFEKGNACADLLIHP